MWSWRSNVIAYLEHGVESKWPLKIPYEAHKAWGMLNFVKKSYEVICVYMCTIQKCRICNKIQGKYKLTIFSIMREPERRKNLKKEKGTCSFESARVKCARGMPLIPLNSSSSVGLWNGQGVNWYQDECHSQFTFHVLRRRDLQATVFIAIMWSWSIGPASWPLQQVVKASSISPFLQSPLLITAC